MKYGPVELFILLVAFVTPTVVVRSGPKSTGWTREARAALSRWHAQSWNHSGGAWTLAAVGS